MLECKCTCHTNGVKFILTSNPPQDCCKCWAEEMTKEDSDLIKRLSQPPKCMHPPSMVIDRENNWQCGKCGLIAKKTIPTIRDEDINDHDERIADLEKIEAEIRLLNLEKAVDAIAERVTSIYKNDMKRGKKPHVCPLCEGQGGTMISGTIDEECWICDGERIVWG